MEPMDASAFEQLLLNLKLVSASELAEVHDEVGRAPDLQVFIAALERKGYLTPWQRGKVLKGDTDGFYLGGYRLLYKISSGSFGRVFRAEDPRDGKVVAIKVLRRRWSEDQQHIDLFIREGKLGLTIKHPNIVEVLAISYDAASGQYYIVMEFIEGGNLREILQIRKKLTVTESLRIIEDCANALAYANTRHMTHRDIKLTNILVSDIGEAKLVDFGLAQFFSTLAKSDEEKVDRTVDYAGLERATGVEIGDVRSDIYFLGCVLYESLSGRPPLAVTRNKHARMSKARFDDVKPLKASEVDGPPSVLVLVETMMALDPKQRYQTPSQLVDAVRARRRDIEGNNGKKVGRATPRSVFIAESDEHLQNILRDGLKDQGYRVLLAGDPMRAVDRFRQYPFEGLIVDARTTGEDGFRVFAHIVEEANRRELKCAAIVLLDEENAQWKEQLPEVPHLGIMLEHITFKTVSRKLKELMEAAHGPMILPPPASEDAPETPQGSLDELSEAEDASSSYLSESRQPSSPQPIRPFRREAIAAPAQSTASSLGGMESSFPSKAKVKSKSGASGNFWSSLTPRQKTIGGSVLGVLGLLLLLFLFFPDLFVEFDVTKIEQGMTEADVENFFGRPGEDVVESKSDDVPAALAKITKKKRWHRGGKTIEITFQNGLVVSKFIME